MTARQFDYLLAYHCAPALAGIKSANLISIKKEANGNLDELLSFYNNSLNHSGIRMEILCRYETHILVLVYQPRLLWSELQANKNRSFLLEKGYEDWSNLNAVLNGLKKRCAEHCVPHEIGLFLSYPLEDVIGFMDGCANCKLCGYWKVYSDVESAEKRFRQFTLCRNDFCRRVTNGTSILQLLS